MSNIYRQAPSTDGRKSARLFLSDENVRRYGNISNVEGLKMSWLIDAILTETTNSQVFKIVDAHFPKKEGF